jgi:hypothetical protein
MRLEPFGLRARLFCIEGMADTRWRACVAVCLLIAAHSIGCNWQRDDRKSTQQKPVEETPAATDPIAEKPTSKNAERDTSWHTDLVLALAEAKRLERPLLVVSILGDLKRRC